MTDIVSSPSVGSAGSPAFAQPSQTSPAFTQPSEASPALTDQLRHAHLGLDTMSPVNQRGHFEFDRVIKAGPALKRTRKTKSWRSVYLVLRPGLLSIYRNSDETKLRYKINLADLTAVARQRDPKGKAKFVFGLFSPSKNYHLGAKDDAEAQAWVELIRREARLDEEEEELNLASPSGHTDANMDNLAFSSSEAELPALSPIRTGVPLGEHRRPSTAMDFSGAENASYSDFSDSAGQPHRVSIISSIRSAQQPARSQTDPHDIEDMEARATVAEMQEAARIVCQGWILLLKSRSGVKAWKRTWMVLRSRSAAMYKNEKEYSALKVLSLDSILDAVEVDPISSSKRFCMQLITDERGYRFCARDEDDLAKWLGAFKSLLVKRKEAKG